MPKRLVCVFVLATGAATTVFAHHSYAAYDREHKVSVTGQLEQLTLGNPHAMLVVRTDEGTAFSVEWGNAFVLDRTGFTAGMLVVGDRVTVTGSQTWDASAHRMSLVTEIRRSRDGWRWSRDGVVVDRRAP